MGKDIFVAQYTVTEKDGDLRACCAWTKTVPTLLPKTDIVFFTDVATGEKRLAAWDDVIRVAGDLMLDAEMIPPRWFVSNFPTEEQFKQMGATLPMLST